MIGGATAPFGDPRDKPAQPEAPADAPARLPAPDVLPQPQAGAGVCHAKTHLDVLSHHPINFTNPPTYRAINHDDIEVADFHKLVPLIHAAERTGHVLPSGPHPLWATELAWYTKPPSNVRDTACEAGQVARAGPLPALEAGRIGGDQLPASRRPAHGPVLWLIGVFFYNGQQKPSYTSFRFPFVTHRISKSRVQAWGKAPASGKLKIQKQQGNKWHTVKRLKVHGGKVFKEKLRVRGKAKLRGQVGNTTSLVWKQR